MSLREFVVTQAEWGAAVARAHELDASRREPVGQWPYVWALKRGRLLLRWYDYAMGRVEGREAGNGKIRCALRILGCTGEIKNPAAYERLREQFFTELLGRAG
ncbi:MAG: hypothetical protein HYY64_01800 [Candidatus Rokubacteria bacterium]|nr:hypothetical protein [Candidatus Rokubacteria bacterium]